MVGLSKDTPIEVSFHCDDVFCARTHDSIYVSTFCSSAETELSSTRSFSMSIVDVDGSVCGTRSIQLCPPLLTFFSKLVKDCVSLFVGAPYICLLSLSYLYRTFLDLHSLYFCLAVLFFLYSLFIHR